jgi:molybdopterin converting factor small subunit
MRAYLKVMSVLQKKKALFRDRTAIDIQTGTSVGQVLTEILDLPGIEDYIVVVSGRQSSLEDVLQEGDEVLVFPRTAGG